MNNQERIDLKKIMKNMSSDYEDNTEGIRRMKHSNLIAQDILKLQDLKQKYESKRDDQFTELCRTQCPFLFSKYTDIFNRVVKDELDLSVMGQVLMALKQIEDGNIDQQEASVMVGKLLHKLYVDSALKRGANLDANNDEDANTIPKNYGTKMSWKDYKNNLKNIK